MPELLSVGSDSKTVKGQVHGYLTGILYLAPSDISGTEICYDKTEACEFLCLNESGHGAISKASVKFEAPSGRLVPDNSVQKARLRKTALYLNDEPTFFYKLTSDMDKMILKADKLGLLPCFRLNGTSDLVIESLVDPNTEIKILKLYPEIQFYDYTKSATRYKRFLSDKLPDNYHLIYSVSEKQASLDFGLKGLSIGGTCAIVFDKVPKEFMGYPVVDGDNSDLRFLDKSGVIVGLKAKGKARKDQTGFVRRLAVSC